MIAPYATALALMVAPEEACENLQRLAADGILGRYGFYEAVDYTPARLRRAQTSAVVRSFMAHHRMSLLSLAYLLLDRPMQRRFVSDLLFQATLLLLQERIPKANALYLSHPERVDSRAAAETPEMPMRVFSTPDTRTPAVQLLSNGRYNVMITNQWGTFCYLRDLTSGKVWSSAFQPTLTRTETYEAVFTEQRVEFRRHDPDFDTHTEIVVSPEDDIELRRVRITNRSGTRRMIEVTSYAEVVLAAAAADALHPAFSKLFVQTEIVHAQQAILCTRRPRSRGEQTLWMLHLMAVHGVDAAEVSYETDRARFVGRGNSASDPQALRDAGGALSGSQGSVLDPIVAIRQRITLDPLQTATLDRSPVSARAAPPACSWPRNTRTGASPIERSKWHRRTARWRCGRSTSPRPTPSSMGAWPARSSTPMPRCARKQASSPRTGADNLVCGDTRSRGICPSCWCS